MSRLDLELGVAGCDPSTVRAAIARVDGRVVSIEPAPRTGEDRLGYLHTVALDALVGAEVLVIEGYPWGVKAKGLRALAEAKGALLLAAWMAGAVAAHVNPSTLKVYATGNGNATKAAMLDAARAAGGTPAHHDAADAMWLRAMGRHHYLGRTPADDPDDELAARRRRAIRVVTWPFPRQGGNIR